MRIVLSTAIVTLLLCASASLHAETIEGIGPTGPIEKVKTGFKFTEGPAGDDEGNLYFTDIPNNRIHKLDVDDNLSVFLEPSGHCNGLMVIGDELYACEMDGRLKAINLKTKEVRVLASEHNGKRFNAPNDLTVDRTGGVYFTDPRFRSPEPYPQGTEGFYYRAADGKVTRMDGDLPAPNGITLSPDETRVFVFPTFGPDILVYDVVKPGVLSARRVFASMKLREGESKVSGADGATVDVHGNIYATTSLGVQIFDPAGKNLGTIKFPAKPANVAFGGKDRKTLYATAGDTLYRVPMKVAGHVFRGGK